MDNVPETIEYTISADGTTIGYRQYGRGPGLVLVHGGMMSSQNFEKLAAALSDAFTVYVPDRRGRGLSGPYGNNYCLAREAEDIQAVIKQTASRYLFGLSSGAIIALQAAHGEPSLKKLAVYEPPLPINGINPAGWAGRYRRELQAGNIAAAMVTVLKGTSDTWSFGWLPRFILVPMMRMAVRNDSQDKRTGHIPLDTLVRSMYYDTALVTEMAEKASRFSGLACPVLLMGGARSHRNLKKALKSLASMIPGSAVVTFAGTGHIAADNHGKPELVSDKLKAFFD